MKNYIFRGRKFLFFALAPIYNVHERIYPKNKDISRPVSSLQHKPYLQDNPYLKELFPSSTLKILYIHHGLPALNDQSKSDQMIFGELDVYCMSSSQIWDSRQQEEIDIRLSGQRKWALEMFPSGPISNFFGRQYGRDYYDYNNKPHAVIVNTSGANFATRNIEILREECQKNNIPLFINSCESIDISLWEEMSKIKNHFKVKLINNFLDKKYHDGYNQGVSHQYQKDNFWMKEEKQQSYNQGYRDGQRQTVVMIKDNDSYTKGVNDGYKRGANDQFQEDKSHIINTKSDTDHIYQKGYDDGYKKGTSDQFQEDKPLITNKSDNTYQQGYNDGYREGFKKGCDEGKKESDVMFAKGYEQGLNERN